MATSVEEKVLEKLRAILIADSTLDPYLQTRVYTSHVSSISQPKYPAISMHVLDSGTMFSPHDVVRMDLQLDIWLPSAEYQDVDLWVIKNRIRELLHRANLIDTTIGLKVAQCVEIPGGPLMFEEDTQLFHLPTRYEVVAL